MSFDLGAMHNRSSHARSYSGFRHSPYPQTGQNAEMGPGGAVNSRAGTPLRPRSPLSNGDHHANSQGHTDGAENDFSALAGSEGNGHSYYPDENWQVEQPYMGPSNTLALQQYATQHGLNAKNQQIVVSYDKMRFDTTTKQALANVHVLGLKQQVSGLQHQMSELLDRTRKIETMTETSWKLSDAQKESFKRLLFHLFVQPTRNYAKIAEVTMTYISNRKTEFDLQVFATSEITKATVRKFLDDILNDSKSRYRKELFKLVKEDPTLVDLAEDLVASYHLFPAPQTVSDPILAQIALQRQVAAPLLHLHDKRDTGFWKRLDEELRKHYQQARKADDPKAYTEKWQRDLISKDQEKYKELSTSTLEEAEAPVGRGEEGSAVGATAGAASGEGADGTPGQTPA